MGEFRDQHSRFGERAGGGGPTAVPQLSGPEHGPKLAEDRRRGSPHDATLHEIRAVSERPASRIRVDDHGRDIGHERRHGRLEDGGHFPSIRHEGGSPRRDRHDRLNAEVARRDPQRIETADDLDREWFEGAETVGVTAGASTPK